MVWPILMALFWMFVILYLIWFVRSMVRSKKDKIEDGAIDIVKKRYTKGEINRGRIWKMKDDLTKT